MPIIRDIVYGAAAHGASFNAICRKLKIDPADLDDSEKRADFETSCLAWELAVKMTGDRQLGLRIGESSNPSIMGLVGYLMQNSATLLDAFRQVTRYGRVATNMFSYEIISKNDDVILQYTPVSLWRHRYPNGARQAVDQAMAGTLNVFYLLSGKRISPKAWRKDQLIFSREQLQTPVLHYDRSLFKVFEGLVRKKRQVRSFADTLKDIILNDFKGNVPPVEVLASKLNITTRTLQRRLAAENTNFRGISGQITREVGRSLLQSGEHRVVDVAHLLGYSSPRAFRRAYKSAP